MTGVGGPLRAPTTGRDVSVAVVGMGYWGPNLLRNAWETPGVRVFAACDRRATALETVGRRYPGIGLVDDVDRLLADPEVDAVMIATPVSTHFDLARRALEAGLHVFVEKPLAGTAAECEQLIALAGERERILMTGHTFLYSPPVVAVKRLLEAGELGRLHFGTFSRVNLGIHQSDVSVVRDLAPHDFSIALYWLGEPSFVRAIGRDSIVKGMLDVVFVDLGYPDGSLVHVELSWLAPTKLRRTVLVGSQKMIVYEDTSTEQVRIYDRGIDNVEPHSFGEHQLSYRSGDVLVPRLDASEPLSLEVEDFVRAIRTGEPPRSSAQVGLQVVRMIEATEASLQFNGAPVPLGTTPTERRRSPDRRQNVSGMPSFRAGDQDA